MDRIQKMRPLACKLFPGEFFKETTILFKFMENLNFAFWKMVFSNFNGAPQLNWDT